MMKKVFVLALSSIVSMNIYAADGWTGSQKIIAIDSLSGNSASFVNKVFISMKDYSNPKCSNNRVALYASDNSKFDQMLSMALSAMHTEASVDFYIPNISNCDSNRLIIRK